MKKKFKPINKDSINKIKKELATEFALSKDFNKDNRKKLNCFKEYTGN